MTTSLVFNGINGATGEYLLPEKTPQEIARIVLGEKITKDHLSELKDRRERAENPGDYIVKAGIDAQNLAQAGWGVIFAYDETEEVKDALKELLAYRREQAGERYQEYAYRYDPAEQYFESKTEFLARHKVAAGPADPKKMPYYLLIVGDPERIPYTFQYELDVQYAVGRIYFDTAAEYAQYAHNVVNAEQSEQFLAREALFFGVRNPDDAATNFSADELVCPLADLMAKDQPDWKVRTRLAEQTRKTQLEQILNGKQPPALLFTASHGMGFPNGHPEQFPCQGALLCQDWPGPREWKQAIPPDYYFSAADLSDSAQLLGLIAFHFACYGAGTPRRDEFALRAYQEQQEIAPRAFLAKLPQKLLQRGALAAAGHVERAWGYSFMWQGAGAQLTTFESHLKLVMEGHRIGEAFEYFNGRYAELSTVLTTLQEKIKYEKYKVSDVELAGIWTANNDARNYMIIGDPAVRLPISAKAAVGISRPIIEVITMPETTTQSETTFTASPPSAPELDFGFLDSMKQAQTGLTNAIREFTEKLSHTLQKGMQDLTSLDVTTYISDDLSDVTYDSARGDFSGNLKTWARTRISLDGDVRNCIYKPKDQDFDQALWAIHADMIQRGKAQRDEMLKTLSTIFTELVKALK